MIKFVSDEENVRVDKYLASVSDYSREFIQKLIDHKLVLVNNKEVKASFKVSLGDEIWVYDEKLKIDEDILGRPGIVHRIDKDTSGLLLVAKTNQVHEILADDFKHKRVKREYLALLDGVFKNGSATIDAPIGRDEKNREKMAVVPNGKAAVTHMKVLKRYHNYTLISCILETGRTHQIRVHMAYIGYPVHNDPVYSKRECTSFGQFLHSYKMIFIHPITKKEMEFISPLPKYFGDFLDELEKEEI